MGEDIYFSVPGVATVRWDEANRIVAVVWEGWANSAEFRGLLDAEVKALKDHQASRLLADCRLQRILNPTDQERADHEWVPRALEAGLKRFAVVLPLSELAADHVQQRLGKVPSTTMAVGFFTSVDAAQGWLCQGAES